MWWGNTCTIVVTLIEDKIPIHPVSLVVLEGYIIEIYRIDIPFIETLIQRYICFTLIEIDHRRNIRATLDAKVPQLLKHVLRPRELSCLVDGERTVVLLDGVSQEFIVPSRM